MSERKCTKDDLSWPWPCSCNACSQAAAWVCTGGVMRDELRDEMRIGSLFLDLARYRALGNAVVPQVAEVVGRRVMELAS